MILLCDENLGRFIPEELNWKGYDARSSRSLGWLRKPDVDWLPEAGLIADSLVLSCDRMMIKRRDERQAIISNNVGVVFLTSGEEPVEDVVRLLSANWSLLEQVHLNTSRPFARFLTPDGQLLDEYDGRRLESPLGEGI